MKFISFMLSNKCVVASYISPLEPKNIKLENNLPILNFSVISFKMYVAIALRPTAYFQPLNTWIPLFYYFFYALNEEKKWPSEFMILYKSVAQEVRRVILPIFCNQKLSDTFLQVCFLTVKHI